MNCINCNKETNNPKYCSRSCAATHTNKSHPKKKTKKLCVDCGESVISYRHNRCKEHHELYQKTKFDYRKTLPLKEFWNKESLINLHKSSKNVYIRQAARKYFGYLLKKPCHKCGYNKHVELCHIKSISNFNENNTLEEVNSIKNLIQLCPNCHWELDNGLITL